GVGGPAKRRAGRRDPPRCAPGRPRVIRPPVRAGVLLQRQPRRAAARSGHAPRVPARPPDDLPNPHRRARGPSERSVHGPTPASRDPRGSGRRAVSAGSPGGARLPRAAWPGRPTVPARRGRPRARETIRLDPRSPRPSRTPPPPPPPPPTPRDPGQRLARSGGADAGRAPGRGSTAARLPAGGRARRRVQRRELPCARLPGGDLRADGGGSHGVRPPSGRGRERRPPRSGGRGRGAGAGGRSGGVRGGRTRPARRSSTGGGPRRGGAPPGGRRVLDGAHGTRVRRSPGSAPPIVRS